MKTARTKHVCVGILVVAAVTLLVSPSARAQQCIPDCRTGYQCMDGQCISSCNPDCPAGFECSAGRQCTPVATAPGRSYYPTNPMQRSPRDLEADLKPVAGPAALFSIGGAMMIAGGAVLGAKWTPNRDSPAEYAGASVLLVGSILTTAAIPWLSIRIARRRRAMREIERVERELSFAPIVPARADRQFGLSLQGSF